MPPPHQRLQADEGTGVAVALRLVVDFQLAPGNAQPQLGQHVQPVKAVPVPIGVVSDDHAPKLIPAQPGDQVVGVHGGPQPFADQPDQRVADVVPRRTGELFSSADDRTGANVTERRESWEPQVGVEPTTTALQERCSGR